MVDLKDSTGKFWSIQMGGSPLTPLSIELDGEKIEILDISISTDSRPNRIIIHRNGENSVAFYAKVGDRWWIHLDGNVVVFDVIEPGASTSSGNEGELTAPMPGKVVDVPVKKNESVKSGQTLVILEAMKMEHKVTAPSDGNVKEVLIAVGDQVESGSTLVILED